MLVLALDTTTRPGSIALVRDEELVAAVSGDLAKTHAERLPADIVRMLAATGVPLSAVDAFGVAAGPGSFTGLRIGIATVQGLAFALNRPVVAVSCLDALASIAWEAASVESTVQPPLLAAWMDAQRSEVFAALYDPTPGSGVRSADFPPAVRPGGEWRGHPAFGIVYGPVSERPDAVLERWQTMVAGRTVRLAGDGVGRYRDLLVRALGDRLHVVEPLPPLAPVIGRMAIALAAAGQAVPPHAVRPIYVRRPDAELARDRRQPHSTDPRDGH